MSSLYRMVHGVNQATFFLLPMLGKHPDEYPRFRDCFMDEGDLLVLTRTGGGNREEYAEANANLEAMETYKENSDWEEDYTYAVFRFGVPTKWQADFDKIIANKFKEVSDEYLAEMQRVYPKLAEKFQELMR